MNRNLYIVYPGRFQPFHIGHKSVYDFLVNKFSLPNVYISTTDNTDDPTRSPFNFVEKRLMMQIAGVPVKNILNVRNNYNIKAVQDLISGFDVNNDILLFVVSKKDMSEDPRFKKFTKKDGSPSYLQPYDLNKQNLKPASQHSYLYVSPTFDFNFMGQNIKSATQVRNMYAELTDENDKRDFVSNLFKITDQNKINIIVKLFDKKLSKNMSEPDVKNEPSIEDQETIDPELKENLKKYLKKEGLLDSLINDPKKTLSDLEKNLKSAYELKKTYDLKNK